jgi:hypothetical protein
MLADFEAVEPFGKIAMRVLRQRASMRVSFSMAVPPAFIRLAAVVHFYGPRSRSDRAQSSTSATTRKSR